MARDYGRYGRIGPAKGFTWNEVRCTDGTLPLDRLARHRHRRQGVDLNRLRLGVAREHGISRRRAYDDVRIVVNSWYRSPSYNAKIGGAPLSQHVQMRATDVQVYVRRGWRWEKLTPATVGRLAAKHVPRYRRGGIGVYPTFTHLDRRPDGPARW